MGKELDWRTRSLAGEPKWIRSGLEVFSRGAALNSHDWVNMMQSAGDFILADLFPDQAKMRALLALHRVCNELVKVSSVYNADNRDDLDRLKLRTIEALCLIESVIPATELAVMFHIIIHVPDCVYRWNNVRNYWSFFGERIMGYRIRFIHNRDLAAENICTANLRLRYMSSMLTAQTSENFQRLVSAGSLFLPKRSLLANS
jgi:hypothetical protein